MKSIILGLLFISAGAIAYPFELMDITDTPRRSPAYDLGQMDVLDYDLHFSLFPSWDTISCAAVIVFRNLTTTDSVYAFDLEEAILFAPEPLVYYMAPGSYVWEEASAYYDDSLLWLGLEYFYIDDTVTVSIMGFGILTGTGVYNDIGPDGNIVYTLFWPSLARRAFPCIDHPGDRATCTMHLTVPESLTVAAGGVLTDSIAADSGYVSWTFRYDEPVCTYNISFAVGNYAVIETTALDSLPVKSYAYPSEFTQTAYDFGRIPEMVALWDSLFGSYPFPRVGCVVTPMSVWGGGGAMEHQMLPNIGDVLITGGRTYETVVAHELLHQWFGDCVGIAEWADFWLNEGIAVYSEVLWVEHTEGVSAARSYMSSEETSYRNWVDFYGDFPMYDPANFLSPVPYNKGACWWNMLRWMLGDDAFFGFLPYYFDRFAYKTVITDSLETALEDYTLTDWDWYFDQWVYRQGYPKYKYNYRVVFDGSDWHLELFFNQAQMSPACTLYTNPLPVEIHTPDSMWEITVTPTERYYDTTIALDDTIDFIWVDRYNTICGTFEFDPSAVIEEVRRPGAIGIIAYPNPFNSSITISIDYISESVKPSSLVASGAYRGVGATGRSQGQVGLEIFDITGRLVADLPFSRTESRGDNDYSEDSGEDSVRLPTPLIWAPDESLESGIYFLRVSVEGDELIRRVVYLK